MDVQWFSLVLPKALLFSRRYLYILLDDLVAKDKMKVVGRGGRRGARVFGLRDS